MSQLRKILSLILLGLMSNGCATVQGLDENRDPFEGFNRAMFAFNDGLDKHLIKPVAKGYEAVLPEPVNNSISNVFSNLDDILVIVNDILQLKLKQTFSDLTRFTINSTAGLLGIFDLASGLDLPKHHEDFGQTLGYWGVNSGPYLMLPLFGPSTLRDGTGLIADWQIDPVMFIEDDASRWGTTGLRVVDTRAGLLRASRLLDTASLDRYAFLRDSYLQKRNSLIFDGNPPSTEMDDFDPFAED